MGLRGEVFSSRASSGNRTYFFNVKENRAGDLFLNIVESKKHGEEGFERHQIVVFEEELTEFLEQFGKAAEFMKRNMSGKPKRRYDADSRFRPAGDNRESGRRFVKKPERDVNTDTTVSGDGEELPKKFLGGNNKPNATVRVRRKATPESEPDES